MLESLPRLVRSNAFQGLITGAIIFAALLVGIETYPSVVERHGHLLELLDQLILIIFVAELCLKILAEGKQPWRYFCDPWNVLDFAIVAVALLPMVGQQVTVLRLARLLRVLRLLRAVPKLQILVGALLKSLPSMGYVTVLLLLVFYVYAVAGVFLFGQNDPFRFRTLPVALVTLFQVATAEDWSTTLYTQMYGCTEHGYDGRQDLCTAPTEYPVLAPIYFVSFILIGTMIILNLFIGVITNSMAESQKEADERAERERVHRPGYAPSNESLEADLRSLEEHIQKLQQALRAVAVRAQVRSESERPADR